ncbi:MAG TPA: ABC transporter permease [Gemmatimonadaceae bacterium]
MSTSSPDWRGLVRAAIPDRITSDPAHDEDIVEELAQHLAQRFDEHLARGIPRDRALELAIAELAAPDSLARSIRESARQRPIAPVPPITGGKPSMWNDFLQDLRYGTRVLLRSRGFAAAAVLTLSIGIGATTAIFSVVNGVLLQRVPFHDLDRLAMVWETDRNTGTNREPSSFPDFVDMKERSRQFAGFAAFAGIERTLTPPEGDPIRLPVLVATHDLLPLLGIQPSQGRVFTMEEDKPGGPSLALISDRLWERQFQRAPDIIGKTIRLNDVETTIIGIVPASADFGTMQILRSAAYARGFADRDLRSRVDVWIPAQADPRVLVRDTHPLLVLGRLTPGATVATAQQELTTIMADLEAAYPSNVARGAFIEPLSDVIFSRVRGTLWVLLAAVGFVLLIACVNVANLLLARGTARLREVAVRTAMGAPLARLVRQFAAENLVLTAVSAVLGVVIAFGALRLLVTLAPADIPRITEIRLDGIVLAVAAGLAVVTGLAFGIVPAIQAKRVDLQGALKADDSRGSTAGRGRNLLRSTLVISEVALAVVLLVGAGLLVKSAWRLSQVDTGYRTENVVKAEFQLPASRYPAGRTNWPNLVEIHRFNDDLLRRVAGIPGVSAAAIVGNHPVDPGSQNSWRVVGRESEGQNWPEVSIRRVSTGYFETVQLPVRSGRGFRDGDGPTDPTVSIINETLARRFFEGREPVGQQIRLWGSARTIVGVVKDERINGLSREAPPLIYLPYRQAPSFNGAEALLVRTSGPTSGVGLSVSAAVRQIDPQLAVFGVKPLADVVGESVAQQRFVMLLLLAFAGVAVILAAIGIHGILSYTVAQRRHELGIRVALGATPDRVTGLVLGQGALLTGTGLVIGVLAALALTRVLATQLYGVSTTDLTAFAAVLPVLGLVALLATWLPARKAVRLDPLEAMRD